jgi:8-oxo-dGTP pyrophosphatase MutT (NUDIX family)
MEKVFCSVAMIRRYVDNRAQWLTLWDNTHKWWDFVTGQRLESESFRETALREVSWRLNLDRKSDFLVSNMSQLNMEYVGQLPGDLTEKHIAVAFYCVDLYKSAIASTFDDNDQFCWLTSEEVCAGQQNNGPLLNPLICHWNNRWQIILPWQ